jgi:hypothetical protein
VTTYVTDFIATGLAKRFKRASLTRSWVVVRWFHLLDPVGYR